MDELPDLKTDADVDALMGRLRARLAPTRVVPIAAARLEAESPIPAGGATGLSEVLAAQDRLAATLGRAVAALADALDELDATDGAGPADLPPLRAAARRRRSMPDSPRRKRGRGSRRA